MKIEVLDVLQNQLYQQTWAHIKQKKADWLTIISFSQMMNENGLCEKTPPITSSE